MRVSQYCSYFNPRTWKCSRDKSEPLSIEKDSPRSDPSPRSRTSSLEKEEEKKVIVMAGQHSLERSPQNPPSVLEGTKMKEFKKKKVANLGIIQIHP